MFKIRIARVQMKLKVTKSAQICRVLFSNKIRSAPLRVYGTYEYTFKDVIKQLCYRFKEITSAKLMKVK